jgi:hypothetical protein
MIFSIATYGKPAHDNCNKLVTRLLFLFANVAVFG